MSETTSTLLDNTRKDLIGGITASVLLAAFCRADAFTDTSLDFRVKEFLSVESAAIRRFVLAVVSAANASEITEEILGTIADLVPREPEYYDKPTVNGLLSLYAGSRQLKDFWINNGAELAPVSSQLFEKKLNDLVFATLWCRVEAYEKGAPTSSNLDLTSVYSSSIALLPQQYQMDLTRATEWISLVATSWEESESVRRGLRLTAHAPSGLSRVISEI